MTPGFKLVMNGKDKTSLFGDRLETMTITDNSQMHADTLSLSLDDRDNRLPLPKYKEIIDVSIGYQNNFAFMGKFHVDETTVNISPKRLDISAKSADMGQALKEPKTRSWHEVLLGDVVKKIAADHGLGFNVDDELVGIYFPHVNQTEESDLHFLTRLMRQYDAMMKIANAKINIYPRGKMLLDSVIILAENVKSGSYITNKGRMRYASVKVKYRDSLGGKEKFVVVGEGSPVFEVREPALDEAHAYIIANAKFKRMVRAVGELSFNLVGDPLLMAGTPIVLGAGFKPDYADSEWLITDATHSYARGGYATQINAELPNK